MDKKEITHAPDFYKGEEKKDAKIFAGIGDTALHGPSNVEDNYPWDDFEIYAQPYSGG